MKSRNVKWNVDEGFRELVNPLWSEQSFPTLPPCHLNTQQVAMIQSHQSHRRFRKQHNKIVSDRSSCHCECWRHVTKCRIISFYVTKTLAIIESFMKVSTGQTTIPSHKQCTTVFISLSCLRNDRQRSAHCSRCVHSDSIKSAAVTLRNRKTPRFFKWKISLVNNSSSYLLNRANAHNNSPSIG